MTFCFVLVWWTFVLSYIYQQKGVFSMYFTDQLEENMAWLNQALHVDKNFDVVYRVLTIADKKPAYILLTVLQKMTLS